MDNPSFGLKTAPSIFQKATTTIFQLILHHTLVYINDLLLFSGTHDEHHKLLQQFFQIIQEHGIMISEKKSTIATSADFLGIKIQDDHYLPGPHIAQKLLHFPESNFTEKQVQQFLGIINYIRDFLPHVNHHTSKLSALLKKNPPSW